MVTRSFRPLQAVGLLGSVSIVLGGCAALPASGPTASQIIRSTSSSANTIGFRLEEIDANVLRSVSESQKSFDAGQPTLAPMAQSGRNDTVGPGDVLAISVYEVGVALFGGGRAIAEGFDPSARGETFPSIVVDKNGTIALPYVGRIAVAGRTPSEIEDMIERGLKGQSQNPQALVTVKENITNTVFVSGDVRRPGRFELTLGAERLLDAIASSGGAANTAEDTIVRFTRAGTTIEERLGRIRAGQVDDLVLLPGDRIELIKRPRTYIVLGATSRVQQVNFETGDVSLAEAIARAGGPSDTVADPSAIFLFRYDPTSGETGADVPVVYRLNLMKATSYFLAQRFEVRDKDVIYIGNAAANQPAKLVSIVNQLFSPFITARALTR